MSAPVMSDPTVVLGRDVLLDLADNERTLPSVRMFLYACERADAEGVATFEAGEWCDLLGLNHKRAHRCMRVNVDRVRFVHGSRVGRIRLGSDVARPLPVPMGGARYGSLTLTARVNGKRWAGVCACGHRSTWSETHLSLGLATHACSAPGAAA